MLNRFKEFIKKEELFTQKDKILLAVSGGADSMVMAHLFQEIKANFGIAHCNFQLRGKESDGDEILVKELADKWKVPFHTIRFETIEEGKKQKKSTELIARELRYNWFNELIEKNDYQYIATAHHLNDSLETVLYNLIKGTGIRGLHGIPIKNEKVIRPLSFTTRHEVLNYAKVAAVPFREDTSNLSTKHNRNLIRLNVIPQLKKVNPSLEPTFEKTLNQLKETEQLFNWAIEEHKKKLVQQEGDLLKIDKKELAEIPTKKTVLFEFIQEFGFNSDQVEQILVSMNTVGAQFYSKTHQLLVERNFLIIKVSEQMDPVYIEITEYPAEITLPNNRLVFERLTRFTSNYNLGKETVLVDIDSVKFPIIVRNWKEGDRFQPIGMKGQSKKVKDYLRDEKVTRFEKEEVIIVESDGKIVWVVGHRMDNRFKLDLDSKTLQISLLPLDK